MSNQRFQQRYKKISITLSFALCIGLAIVGEFNHSQFIFGITFSLTSLFVLLGIRLFGLWPGIAAAAIVYSIGPFLLDMPYIHYIELVEAVAVGLLMQKFRNHMYVCDALFWLLIGMPLIYLLCHSQYPAGTNDLLLIACIVALNGVFNALFAEIIEQYVPFRKWFGLSAQKCRPLSFSKVLFHFSTAIVFVSFLLSMFMNSISSYKEVSLYAARLSSNEVHRISDAWQARSKPTSILSKQEQHMLFQSLIDSRFPDLSITITDQAGSVIASRKPEEIGTKLDLTANNKVTPINQKSYLTLPKQQTNPLYYQTWHDGNFVYMDMLPNTELSIFVEVPIRNYKGYLFSKYMTNFIYLAGLAFFAGLLAFLINRWLVRSLTSLAVSTTNLPLKLRQMNAMEWPESRIVEIHSLIANFKHMSTDLLHMFHESQKNNERLEAQAFMLQQSEERLHQLAYYDDLTRLPNRLQFTHHFQDLISFHTPTSQPIAVMFADINRFKQINDTLGHAVGDAILQKAAERFGTAAFKNCTVFRLGGDEFVFVGRYENEESLNKGAQTVCDSFNLPFIIEDATLFLTISVGISVYPYDGDDMETITRNADIAMYSAKEQGDGCYRFFKPNLVSVMTEKMQLENGLYNALLENQFTLYYQPKMNAVTGELCGIEALIRWQHPELGMVPPDKFIPLAEQSGFILEIDNWVFREACRQNKAWQDAGLQRVCVSVNISGRHFYQGNLTEMIVNVLEETGLDSQYVSIEITEGVFMRNMEHVIETILYLRKLGILISIDDFGTGYSSLNQLQRLPISDVKLDRSFIQGITNDEKKSSIVKAIIELVHSMNMKVVAEGVETMDESRFCTELKCDELQGYLFSRPLPPQQFELMLGKAG